MKKRKSEKSSSREKEKKKGGEGRSNRTRRGRGGKTYQRGKRNSLRPREEGRRGGASTSAIAGKKREK